MNSEAILIALMISLSAFLGIILFIRITKMLFTIYRENFLTSVDRGLQDVLLYMDPRQLFTLQMLLILISFPIMLLVFNAAIAIVVVATILALPRFILPMMKKNRNAKLILQLPDTLSSLSASLRSGLNLIQSLQQIVKNQPAPISQEFAQVLIEYRMGKDLNDSLDALANRVEREELLIMNSSIKIARAVGGNLSDTLDALAETLREKARLEGRIQALTSMGKAQAWVATFFPVVVGYLLYRMEPVAVGKLFTTMGGWMALATALALVVLANLIIRKLVNIDV